jgi:hypothetical protein
LRLGERAGCLKGSHRAFRAADATLDGLLL